MIKGPGTNGLCYQALLLCPSAGGPGCGCLWSRVHSLLGCPFHLRTCEWSRSPAVIQSLFPSRGNVNTEWQLGNIREVWIF